MKIRLLVLKFVLLTGTFLILAGCNTNESKTKKGSDSLSVAENQQLEQKVFYLMPSPEDLFKFTENRKLVFSPKVLNPIENADKYGDIKSKELNFGIYSADLAYNASFNKYHETIEYTKIVRELSDAIGVSSIFDETLIKRIDKIIDNQDSLKHVTSDLYRNVVIYLEKNNRKRTQALLVTGGWLETLYIVTSLVDKYSSENPTIQQIADQKLVFENLLAYLDQNKNDEAINAIITQLSPIKTAYEQINKVKVASTEQKSDQPNKFIIGGGSKLSMSDAQFKQLKEAIAKVRNSISGNRS